MFGLDIYFMLNNNQWIIKKIFYENVTSSFNFIGSQFIYIFIYIQYKSILFNPTCFRFLHANRVTPIRDEPIQEKSLC